MSMLRPLVRGPLGALAAWMAMAPVLSCGGSRHPAPSEPSAGGTGRGAGWEGAPEEGPDTECCCQRYDEDGDPTGAVISDRTACKSTGGTCTDDTSQCENE